MKKSKLTKCVNNAKTLTGASLQLLWDNVNKGQKKQILKKPEIVEMFKRFGVNYEE